MWFLIFVLRYSSLAGVLFCHFLVISKVLRFSVMFAAKRGSKVFSGFPVALQRYKCNLPDLPYDFNALEPYISADIMKLHYSKHHQTYVNNYNVAEEQLAVAVSQGNVSKIIRFCSDNL